MDIARAGSQRVCVVDLSLTENTLSRQLGIPVRTGLVRVLEGEPPAPPANETVEYEGLTIVPAGKAPDNAARVARSSAVPAILDNARSTFDVIIVDLPAVTSGNVSPIAPHLDAMLVVVNAGVTSKETAAGALERLDQSKVLGIVLNHVTPALPS
jgi:succinoglycan biosynthesis transport protein ExoP